MQRNNINGILVISGTAAERAGLAANIAGKGAEFWESDTNDKYRSNGAAWKIFENDGISISQDTTIALLQGLEDGSGNPKTALSDLLPVTYLNLGVAATPGTPLTTELTEIDLTLANHSGKLIAATGIVITAAGYGNFMGFHFTYNQASKVSAAAALAIAATPIDTEAWGSGDHQQSYFVANGQSQFIPFNQTLGLLHLIALGAATNVLHVAPV